jgi:uncharacterized membrane protein
VAIAPALVVQMDVVNRDVSEMGKDWHLAAIGSAAYDVLFEAVRVTGVFLALYFHRGQR